MTSNRSDQFILGLDLGSSSVGWAIIQLGSEKTTRSIEQTGSRIFEAGVEGNLEYGTEESRAKKRRDERSNRRRTDRRARRIKVLYSILQDAGLLPDPNGSGPVKIVNEENEEDARTPSGRRKRRRYQRSLDRDATLARLDKSLLSRWSARLRQERVPEDEIRIIGKKLPYILRVKALDDKLSLHELGRALYHLGQRRGFLSNRKAPEKKDEEGVVKEGIKKLRKDQADSGARTLGEYFSGLNPSEERIRERWTSRRMYRDEFELIWAAQQPHYPDVLTDDLKSRIYDAIFFQRPLRSQSHLIGKCEHEPDRQRAPWALLETQRFRLIQKVNNTRILCPDGTRRDLTTDERAKLIEAMQNKQTTSFAATRKLIGLSREYQFNWQEGGETKFQGNTTNAKLRTIFGSHWDELTDDDKKRVVDDVRSMQSEEALARRGINAWGLNEEAAAIFGRLQLEDGYCNLSRQAIAKLLPLMEDGMHYMTAVTEVYGEEETPEPLDLLPPVDEVMPDLRNPAVHRTLTEVRKVVNEIIRQYGKPPIVRIELARDLKRPRADRKRISSNMRKNEKARSEAAVEIINQAGIQNPSRNDILKYILAEECNWECPYTGENIGMKDLYGAAPKFDIEHIIPFSRCLDDSFMNKTLCLLEENRNVKRNRTPYEAYGSNPEKWNEIIVRVKQFKSSVSRAKLERFIMQEIPDTGEFTSQQLNDTRYASKLAMQYLGLLYGEEANKRVQASKGGITAIIRNELDLNSILGGGEKTRDDHRHHAIDAVAIALTDHRTVKSLSDAAGRALSEGRRRFGKVEPPWEGFLDDVRESIDQIVVSHRVDRKINGPLHEETLYAPGPEEGTVLIRKRLEDLSKKDVENIIDPTVRALVQEKLTEVGGTPNQVFSVKSNLPWIVSGDGEVMDQVKRVRIKKSASTFTIGNEATKRHVLTKSNHHLEIREVTIKGKKKWVGEIVTQYEAMRRLRDREPIVRKDEGFVLSLATGEIIEIDGNDGDRVLCRIRTVTSLSGYLRVCSVRLHEARPLKEIKEWYRLNLEPLRKRNCRKVIVTPLGDVRRAND